MKKALMFVLCALCLVLLCACGTAENEAAAITGTITTPYADIVVPDSFIGNVKATVISEEPYVLSFATVSGTELFTLDFGKETENLLGTLELENQNIVLYATFADLDHGSSDYEINCEYQEGINTILEHLISDYDFAVNEIIENEDTATFDIETSVVTMKYPAKWKDKVQVEVSEQGVKFSNNGTPLFDLNYVECDGYPLGEYNGTLIYFVDYPVATDEQASMQEDVNVILQYLMEDPNFVMINY